MIGLLSAATLLLTLFLIRALQAKRKFRLLYLEAKATAEEKTKLKDKDSWVVTYKQGKQSRVQVVSGSTEGKALAAFIGMGKAYDAIVSVTKG